jgi:ribulose-phosphate 3-epimerase
VDRADEIRRFRDLPFRIQVDGGIAPETAGRAVAAGADVLVAGSAIFGTPDPPAAARAIRAAAVA